jgi:hypothetical protein
MKPSEQEEIRLFFKDNDKKMITIKHGSKGYPFEPCFTFEKIFLTSIKTKGKWRLDKGRGCSEFALGLIKFNKSFIWRGMHRSWV